MMTAVSATLLKIFGAPIRSEFGAWYAPKKYDPYIAYANTVIFRNGDRREEDFSFPAFSTFNLRSNLPLWPIRAKTEILK